MKKIFLLLLVASVQLSALETKIPSYGIPSDITHLVMRERYNEALAMINTTVDLTTDEVTVVHLLYQRALIHLNLGNKTALLKDLDRLIIIASNNYYPDVHNVLVEALWLDFAVNLKEKNIDRALNCVDILKSRNKTHPNMMLSDSNVTVISGNMTEARIKALREFLAYGNIPLEADPIFLPCNFYQETLYNGLSYLEQGDYDLIVASLFGDSRWAQASQIYLNKIYYPYRYISMGLDKEDKLLRNLY